MRVIFFTKYTRKGASSRLRTFQYIDFFESKGLVCVVHPFFDDAYLREVYNAKTHNKWKALQSFITRVRILLTLRKTDTLVIEKELFPYLPALAEWLLNKLSFSYIVDYDDAIWHNYDNSSNPFIRFFLASKINVVMRHASVVVAGNKYIEQKAVQVGAKNVIIIPTVIDVDKYHAKEFIESSTFIIGWIGSPITAKYLPFLKSIIERLRVKHDVKLKLVGVNTGIGLGMAEEALAWSEETEAQLIHTFDVGIMPLEDTRWEQGKCGYKLIQYMGCSVPVIGTPIGVNKTLIQQGVNGFQATTEQEWELAFEFFINNPSRKKEMGSNGRQLVTTDYSLQTFRSQWLSLLKMNKNTQQ
jgi:glycosyltransferase involved in cell wall biosynthesis